MDIVVNYTVPISDDVAVQDALKALLDERIDPDNAGGQYAARFKMALKKFGTQGLKNRLENFRTNALLTASRADQQVVRDEVTVGDGVDI